MTRLTRILTNSSAVAALTISGFAAAPALADGEQVFFMLPNSTTIRFERRDAPLYVAAMEERMPGADVTVQNGEGDPVRQQRLVEDAIAQGADLIVYTSSDANLAAGALRAAEEAGVPVLLYEHDAIGGQAEAHVLFNARAVGQAQGQRAAELIEAMPEGTIRIAVVVGRCSLPTRRSAGLNRTSRCIACVWRPKRIPRCLLRQSARWAAMARRTMRS